MQNTCIEYCIEFTRGFPKLSKIGQLVLLKNIVLNTWQKTWTNVFTLYLLKKRTGQQLLFCLS